MVCDVIIPAFNEEKSIALVISEIPKSLVRHIIVVDNNSRDATSKMAEEAGAVVLKEGAQGYGYACLKGMEWIAAQDSRPDVLCFLDGDYSDYPAQMTRHLKAIEEGAELVIGSRVLGKRERHSLTPQQVFGNALACFLIRIFYKVNFTDLGPFRAIRYDTLMRLKMRDKTYGWTAEMQVKAAKMGVRCAEVPVDYRKRIGVSKVSGTLKGTFMAGYKILSTIFKYV